MEENNWEKEVNIQRNAQLISWLFLRRLDIENGLGKMEKISSRSSWERAVLVRVIKWKIDELKA
jgi:hypothetical protein